MAINGKTQVKVDGSAAGHFASFTSHGGFEDSQKGAEDYATATGTLEDQEASDTLPALATGPVWTRLQALRNNVKSLFAKVNAVLHGMELLDGVWFVKTKSSFTAPVPTSDIQNYFDTLTNKKYTAKADLSGWEEAATQPLPTTLVAGQGYYMEVTGQFWDIAESGYAGHMTGVVNAAATGIDWTYAPDKQRLPDGVTNHFNSSQQVETIEVNHTTAAITESTAKIAAGSNPGIIQIIVSKINGIITALALKALASDLTKHTGNADIHVTAAQKTMWSGKQNPIAANAQAGAVMTPPTTAGGAPGVMLPGKDAGTYAAGNDSRFLIFRPDLWPINTEIQFDDNLYGYTNDWQTKAVISGNGHGYIQLDHTVECTRIINYGVDCGFVLLLTLMSALSSKKTWPYICYERVHSTDVPINTIIRYWMLYMKN
jgi:hypothetical protein